MEEPISGGAGLDDLGGLSDGTNDMGKDVVRHEKGMLLHQDYFQQKTCQKSCVEDEELRRVEGKVLCEQNYVHIAVSPYNV